MGAFEQLWHETEPLRLAAAEAVAGWLPEGARPRGLGRDEGEPVFWDAGPSNTEPYLHPHRDWNPTHRWVLGLRPDRVSRPYRPDEALAGFDRANRWCMDSTDVDGEYAHALGRLRSQIAEFVSALQVPGLP